ncbi:cytochrome P450 [Artomyces pyxidatus]|uniref:Cytochrome P450 n=1 Tax=Artomyces pyxidatus TaxID=48021 RepID=A0ACB8SIX9_9AGAM|nr:cytochrome P450 [Artomyces pyxidatus]
MAVYAHASDVSTNSTWFALSATAALLIAFLYALDKRNRRRYPPGPAGIPFIGNVLDLPKRNIAKSYAQWSQRYGPVIYMRIFGRQFVILNSHEAVNALFEKRASKYCHRPRLVMANEIVGRKTMLFTNYGPLYKQYRRLLGTFTPARQASKYWQLQEVEAFKFVVQLATSPDDFMEHARLAATSAILRLLYGIEVNGKDDTFVKLAEDHSLITAEASAPGRWLVDSFPIFSITNLICARQVRYVPAWFPGAHFQRWALDARRRIEAFTMQPYTKIKAALVEGTAVPSWTSEHLFTSTGEPIPVQEEETLRLMASSLYSGGSDTSVSAMTAFFLMMVRYPEVQEKAHREIDALGRGVPRVQDRASLPYIDCIVKEVLRINPVVPMAPHSSAEDDEYQGWTIPKGAWVMANVWALMHDSAVYPEPDRFSPERHEGPNPQPDPLEMCFGFGRRACPGLNFGLASLFINITSVLFAFKITRAKDDDGVDIVPPMEFTDGHVSHPVPFRCRIEVRDEERIALMRQAASSA